MWPRKQPNVSKRHAEAEQAIVNSLDGGDTLPAWNAIWDLVQSRDSQGKQALLEDLRHYVAETVAADPTASAPARQAREFERAIDTSMSTSKVQRRILPSREVRQQAKQDQIETHRAAMRDIGVRPGDGIPMWAMYMTRRNKRSWG